MFANFTIIPKPWHCRHMCGGPDGYRQSPLHQDALIWPKTTDLTGTGSKTRNPALLLRFLSLQFFINSQAGQCRHCQIHRHRNTQTEQRDCLLSLCYCDRSVILWGVQSKQIKPASGRSAQQLTVLGCCLHTKSDMKSNSFCPRKSSGSS